MEQQPLSTPNNEPTSHPLNPAEIAGPPPGTGPATAEEAALESARNSGAGWFYWIAALSLINSVLSLVNAPIHFSLGLASTMVVDAFASELGGGAVMRVVEFGLDLVLIGVTALWGYLAMQGKSWALVTGGILMLLDTLLLLALAILAKEPMILSLLIHGWALFSIFGAWNASRRLNELINARRLHSGSPFSSGAAY